MSHKLQPSQLALSAGVFVLILVLFGAIRHYLFGKEIGSLLSEALFVVAIVTIAFLRQFMPTLRQVVDKGVAYYFLFMMACGFPGSDHGNPLIQQIGMRREATTVGQEHFRPFNR